MVKEKKMDVRKIVSMPAKLIERVKKYRFAKQINSESEAVRVLIEKGLEAEKVK